MENFQEYIKVLRNLDDCLETNSISSNSVFKFCLNNKIKLIYSATSASLGKMGNDKNLSPYVVFTKSNNLELLENLKKWFNLNMKLFIFIMFMD